MTRTVAMVVYEDAQILDVTGPMEVFARRVAVSPRHFTRVFTHSVRVSPAAYRMRFRTTRAA